MTAVEVASPETVFQAGPRTTDGAWQSPLEAFLLWKVLLEKAVGAYDLVSIDRLAGRPQLKPASPVVLGSGLLGSLKTDRARTGMPGTSVTPVHRSAVAGHIREA